MSFHKTHLYNPNLKALALRFKAFAHPARVKIFHELVNRPHTALELHRKHPVSKSSICKHLNVLVQNQLVSYIDQKGVATYFLTIDEFPDWLIKALFFDKAGQKNKTPDSTFMEIIPQENFQIPNNAT